MSGILAAALLLCGAESPQESLVKKVLPDAERVKRVSGRIGRDAQKKIEGILGTKLNRADLAPVVYQCWGTVPSVTQSEKTRCRVVFTSVKGAKGTIKLGVAVAIDDDRIHAVKVMDNKDDPAIGSAEFLKQFDGFEYIASIENEVSKLDGAINAAGSDKGVAAILRTNDTMRAMGPAWVRMEEKIEKKDKSAAAEIDAMVVGLKESLKVLPHLSMLRGSSHPASPR